MTGQDKSFRFTGRCLLREIKKCDKVFKTNIANKKFCCDDHRYQWHNSFKALFRRVAILEFSANEIKERFSKLGKIITESIVSTRTFGETIEEITEFMKDKK